MICELCTLERKINIYIEEKINVPKGDMVQFTTALGAATLALQRVEKVGVVA
jgi:hypothetical protein